MNLALNRLIARCATVACLTLAPVLAAAADTAALPNGAKLDLSARCPVCKMEVSSSILGPAAIGFKDGKWTGFDATGDMFRYLLEPKKYGFDPGTIKDMYVTHYGTRNFIDAKQAVYVVGSDVKGLMGPEAVAFSKKGDAEKFMNAHHGKKVVSYRGVSLNDLKPKKGMLKMQHSH